MKYIINATSVIVFNGNHQVVLPKKTFNTELLNNSILNELSFSDLQAIWKELYGIPKNLKEFLLKKIELYNSSSSINSFIYQGKEYWLDKNNRNSLWNISNSSLGDIEFVVGDEIITMSSLKLKAFLLKLEVYAYKCFVNKVKHLKEAKKLEKVEDMINYDYTTNYPEKITLE